MNNAIDLRRESLLSIDSDGAIKKEELSPVDAPNWKDTFVSKKYGTFKDERFNCACGRKMMIKRGMIVEHLMDHIRKQDRTEMNNEEIDILTDDMTYLTSLLEHKKNTEEEDATYLELLKEFGKLDVEKKLFVCHCCQTENALSSIAITRHLRRCEYMHSLHKISYNLKNDMWRSFLGRVVPFSPVATFQKTPINREEINNLTDYQSFLSNFGAVENASFTCSCIKRVPLVLFDVIEHILGCRKFKLKEKCDFIEGLIIATKVSRKVDPGISNTKRLDSEQKYALPSMSSQLRGIDSLTFSPPVTTPNQSSYSPQQSRYHSSPDIQRIKLPSIGDKRQYTSQLSSSPDRVPKVYKIEADQSDYHEKALKVSENQLERVRLIQQVVKSILDAPPEHQKDILDAIKSM